MAILDIFKKKKGKKAPVIKKKEEKPAEPRTSTAGVPFGDGTVRDKKKEAPKPKKGGGIIYGIVKEPHISEKGSVLAERGQYIFKVFPNANKTEIKKAIEGIYGKDVLSVNIIKIPAKKRRLGKISGFKKGYKKAIVKIKEGQKIEIL